MTGQWWARVGGAVTVLTLTVVGCSSSGPDAHLVDCSVRGASGCVGADLSRRDLRAVYLRGLDLRGANLSRSDLRGVDLRGVRLDRANLVRADLRRADLRDAALPSAALEQADLRSARLDGARFSAARLVGADLRGAHYGTSFWTEADLTRARGAQLGSEVPFDGVCDTTFGPGAVMGCAASLADGPPAAPGVVNASAAPVTALTSLVIRLVQRDRLNPPVASRVYAYTGIALAETAQPNSLHLRDFPAVPRSRSQLDWSVVVASGAPLVPRALSASPSAKSAYAGVRDELLASLLPRVPIDRFRASVQYGRGIAALVIDWANTDGFGPTRDRTYVPPVGEGQWIPTPTTYQGAQEPYWGTLRTYAVGDAQQCAAPAPPPYSVDPASEFMTQIRRVYETARRLTAAQRATARFWADDRGRTGTPTGHWVAIANVAIQRRRLGLGDAARLQGTVAVAAGDAFITTWATKFRWNQIRPVSVIRATIDPSWVPYLNTPPFPDWVSGHATVSSAVARVLTRLVGTMRYRDVGFNTGADVRSTFAVRPRVFSSFAAAAAQAAKSREYAGIHTPASDAAGLASGTCVGQAALSALAPEPKHR